MRTKPDATPRCAGTGLIALDVIRCATDNHTVVERRHTGGSCANVLSVLAFLGWHTTPVGRIGADPLGEEVRGDLARWGVDLRFVTIEKGRGTPIIVQETSLDSTGAPRHRFSTACPVCGASLPRYRPLLKSDVAAVAEALPRHSVFYFDRVAPGTLALARNSRRNGALVVFEPSGVKDRRLFVECLRTAHILKYSVERLTGLDSLVTQGQLLAEIQTLGSEGLRFRTRQAGRLSGWKRMPAIAPPRMRDAAGSGDWCTAGLISQLGASPEGPEDAFGDWTKVSQALRFGQALAALNCAFDGARGLMYALTEAEAQLAARELLHGRSTQLPKPAEPLKGAGRPSSDIGGRRLNLHRVHA